MIGAAGIVVSPSNIEKSETLLEMYSTIKYFISLKGISTVFGLFQDSNLGFYRKKIKESFQKEFDYSKLIFLLESGNSEAYYAARAQDRKFYGIEIRYIDNRAENISRSEMIGGIMKGIEGEKIKLLNKNKW